MKKEITPLVFCMHHFPQRSNAQIKTALTKNWHYISENKKLSKIFPCPSILALRRTLNLGERRIRAKITQTQNSHTCLTPNIQNKDDSTILYETVGTCCNKNSVPRSPKINVVKDSALGMNKRHVYTNIAWWG